MLPSHFARSLPSIWAQLTDPHPAITGLEARQRARVLSASLLAVLPLLLLYFALNVRSQAAANDYASAAVQFRLMLFSSLMLLSTYALSRTRHVDMSALVTLSVGSVIIVYRALIQSPIDADLFYYLALPIMFCALLLSRRLTAILVAGNVMFIAAFMLTTPALRSQDFLVGPIAYLMFMAFIVFLTVEYRNSLEKARQSELTSLVATRTASLQEEIERRSQIEASLRDEAAFYHALFDRTNDAIFIMNLEGYHLRANKRAAEMLGYSVDDIFGRHYTEFVAPEEYSRSDNILGRLLDGETIPVYERVFRRKDGTRLPVELNVALVRDSEGRPRYLQSAARDITERKNFEAWLQDALENEKQLAQMRNRFFSMISHEFRTPLTVILSSNELMFRYADRMDEARRGEHHGRISTQVKHLVTLLDDVMLINKVNANRIQLQPEQLDLLAFCTEILNGLGATVNPTLSLDFSMNVDHASVEMDPEILRRILTNLLSNAIKYSPDGGRVELALEVCSDYVEFRVSDEGIGIPLEDQAGLFEVFHRASNVGKIDGTGLGLVIVKQGVEMQGGQVNFTSMPGEGTTFRVNLPCKPESAVAAVCP
jgi:PAS domain S-box-containing protein